MTALLELEEVSARYGPIQALHSVSLALEQARSSKHLNSVSMSLFFCGLVSFLCRDESATRSYMDELMRLAAGHSIGAWPLLGRAMAGWAQLMGGSTQEGLAAMSAKGQKRSKPKFKHCNHVAISYDARAMDHGNHNH